MKKIHYLKEEDQRKWDEFVNTHPESTFFHLSAWQKMMQEVFHHETYYLYVTENESITGILPLTKIKSSLFSCGLISNPFCVYGGPLYNDLESLSLLDKEAQSLQEKLSVNYLEYRSFNASHQNIPGWQVQDGLYATFQREIHKDPEENLKAIKRKQRAVLRKALDLNELTFQVEQDSVNFFNIYSTSVRNLGTPVFTQKLFDSLLAAFGKNCEIMTIYDEQKKPLTSVLSFYFKNMVMPYYAGGYPRAKRNGAFDYMYWQVMLRAREKGYEIFDFGRSKIATGAYDYKCNWGFEPKILQYEYYLPGEQALPSVNPNNPKYRLFIEIWKRLPLCIANKLGPHIVRQIG